MTNLLEIILAARKRSDGGWFQLLIPIIFVAVYVVSGLAKFRANKRDERDNRIEGVGPAKPRYKPLGDTATGARPASPGARNLSYAKPAQQREPAPRKVVEAQPIKYHQRPAGPDRPGRSVVAKRAKAQRPEPQSRPEVIPPMPTKKPSVKMRPGTVEPLEAQPAISLASLADLTAGENLQTAIIYSEILGKPLALRD